MRRACGNTSVHGNHRLVLLLILGALLCTACGEDTGSCPSDGLPQELVGDWMECDEEWNPGTSGMRIEKDGRRAALGVDWNTGGIGLATQACAPGTFSCVGDHLVAYWLVPGGHDTLRYAMEGDRLELTEPDGSGIARRYRRASLGTMVAEAAVYGFTMRMYDGVFYAPEVWPVIPVRISIDSSAGGRLSFIAEGQTRTSFTLGTYRGPGTYTLGSPATGAWASTETTCTDALRGFRTQDDGRSSVTIYTYDMNDGHSFGAVDLHLADLMGDTLHMTGTFNAVIGR
jgi:hypothetical protein